MRSKVLAFFVCRISVLVTAFALCQEVAAAEFLFYPVLSEARYQRNQDQQMILRPHTILGAGVDVQSFSFLLERAFFEENYGSSPLVTNHQQTSYSLQGRYLIFENKSEEKVSLQFFPSVGLGIHQDRTVTKLYNSESADVSGWEPLATVGFVVRGRYHFLIMELEGRVLSGKLLDPTFSTGGVLRLGFIY